MWLRGWIEGIVILASLEYHFIRVQEYLVQHQSIYIFITLANKTTKDCFLQRYCKLPYNANLVHLQRKVWNCSGRLYTARLTPRASQNSFCRELMFPRFNFYTLQLLATGYIVCSASARWREGDWSRNMK